MRCGGMNCDVKNVLWFGQVRFVVFHSFVAVYRGVSSFSLDTLVHSTCIVVDGEFIENFPARTPVWLPDSGNDSDWVGVGLYDEAPSLRASLNGREYNEVVPSISFGTHTNRFVMCDGG